MSGVTVRFGASALALLLLGSRLPGFNTWDYPDALVAAALVTGFGYGVERLLTRRRVSRFGRGGVGVIVSATVICGGPFGLPVTQVAMRGVALLSVLVGVIDALVPVGGRAGTDHHGARR